MPVIIFDMDETLYDERTYVREGLRTVAAFMQKKWGIPRETAFRLMNRDIRQNGRGKEFDIVLARWGVLSKKNVRTCLSAYRAHTPKLRLYPDATRALRRFKNYPLYVVTDGTVNVQRRKARALGLNAKVKKIIATWSFGKDKSKPSPFCFKLIAKWERVTSAEVIYVGDDPHKDFINLKPLGFRTVRILRGRFKKVRIDKAHEAAHTIRSLDELTGPFLKRLCESEI